MPVNQEFSKIKKAWASLHGKYTGGSVSFHHFENMLILLVCSMVSPDKAVYYGAQSDTLFSFHLPVS